MKNVIKGIAAFYLGFSVSAFANVNFLHWQFWVIVIPVISLYGLSDRYDE